MRTTPSRLPRFALGDAFVKDRAGIDADDGSADDCLAAVGRRRPLDVVDERQAVRPLEEAVLCVEQPAGRVVVVRGEGGDLGVELVREEELAGVLRRVARRPLVVDLEMQVGDPTRVPAGIDEIKGGWPRIKEIGDQPAVSGGGAA